MRTPLLLLLAGLASASPAKAASGTASGGGNAGSLAGFGPTAFTAPGVFPTSVYAHYYNNPTATSAQPQPVISDPVTVSSLYAVATLLLVESPSSLLQHVTYPLALTDPDHIPQVRCLISR